MSDDELLDGHPMVSYGRGMLALDCQRRCDELTKKLKKIKEIAVSREHFHARYDLVDCLQEIEELCGE